MVLVRIIRDEIAYKIRYTHYNPPVKGNRKIQSEKNVEFLKITVDKRGTPC